MPSWKKIIVSGSNAELNHITSSGGININGTLNSISDGLTFGDGDTGFYQGADDDFYLKRGGNTVFRANTSSQIDFGVSSLFYNTTGGFFIKTAAGAVGTPNYTFRNDTDTGMYRSADDTIGFTAGGVLQLEVTTNKISGSSTSTGSFGHLMVGGGNFTSASLASAVAAGDSSFTAAGISGSLGANATFIRDLTAAKVSGSFNKGFEFEGTISGSSTSTGSFGVVESAGDVIARNKAGAFISGDSNKIQLYRGSGQRQFLSDAATGGVAIGAGATVTGDGVSIGYLTVAGGGSSVAIGRTLTTSANEVRIGESGVTDAYLGQGNATLHIGGVVASGDIQTSGDVIANRYIVSSSVSVITSSFSSGSTIFGDDSDDTHKFTGSLQISGGLEVQNGNLEVAGNISGSSISTGSFGRLNAVGNVRTSKLRLSKNATHSSDTTLSIEDFGGGNKLTLSNGAVSLLFDGRHGQNSVGLNFNVNYSGMLGTAAATATNPSIKFTGDTDTGLGRAAADTLSLITGGTEAFRVTSTLISGSINSTGSFGRVQASTIAGNSPLTIEADNFSVDDSGTVSGSATSTGSFGKLFTRGNADVEGQLFIQPKNNTNDATTAEELVIYGASTEAGIAIVANADANNYYTSYIKARYDGTEGFYIKGPSGDKFLSYGHSGTNTRIGVSDTTGTLHLKAKTISGSVVSTGSFGRLQTADTVASFGSHTFTLGGNITTGGTLTTAGNFTTQNNDVTINAVGAGRTLTLNESLTVGDGNDGTITFSGASKTLTVEDNATVDQDLSSDANVTFGSLTTTNNVTVGGDLIVNGTTTTLATSNLEVQDAFGFFATGSAGTNVDAGIIVQSGSAVDSGSALFHDISKERWSVAKGVASTASTITNAQWGGFVATVYTGSASPVGNDPQYGVGEIHIDADGEIYIYS